ncbi:hypothetical protein Tco_0742549 [Tanacetum coccineum]
MGSHTLQQLKRISFDELKALFETTMRRVHTFHLIESEGDKIIPKIAAKSSKRTTEEELEQESSKRQKTNEASGSVQEQPDEEEKELSQEDLHQIMMVVPVEEVYVEALQDMLKVFDRDDLVKLWSLVKERFSSTKPTDEKERILWVELKRERNGYFHAVSRTTLEMANELLRKSSSRPMNKKDQIRLDEDTALNLQAEFDEKERLARQKAEKEEANIVGN